MTESASLAKPLAGARVLVPRGGDVGDRLAAAVTRDGGEPVVAPMIEFDEPADWQALADGCAELSAGAYDWVAITSATTVDVLVRHCVAIPSATQVAVVGPATRQAMEAAGFPVHFMPAGDFSAAGMVAEWPTASGSVFLPQSAIAEPTLADGLAGRGLSVTAVAAYSTRTLEPGASIRRQLGQGAFTAVLLTSASVARAVAGLVTPFPEGTVVACIGSSTAAGARAAGLTVHTVAEPSTAEALVDALGSYLSNPTTDNLKVTS